MTPCPTRAVERRRRRGADARGRLRGAPLALVDETGIELLSPSS